ncbi:MAG: hypothetical protein V4690_00815 [Patescibacteria group bacterium]
MKKHKNLLIVIVAAIGIACLFLFIGKDIVYNKTLNDGYRFIPSQEYIDEKSDEKLPVAEPTMIQCPTKYKNTEYGFEFDCPKEFIILEKSKNGTIGGSKELLLQLECSSHLCQIYPLEVQVWDNESFQKNNLPFIPDIGKKVGNNFIMVIGFDDSVKKVIESFKFTK